MRLHALALGAALNAALAAGAPAQAETLAIHHGDANPTGEGWTVNSYSGSSTGPVLDGGVPAWSLRGANYSTVLPFAILGPVATQGWVLTMIARSVDSGVNYATTAARFYPGIRGWSVWLGNRANGDAFVLLLSAEPFSIPPGPSGPSYTMTGDPAAYHRFDLVCPPSSTAASLYVDGILRIADHPGYTHAWRPGFLLFGSSDPVGQARYHHVELRVGSELPVPAEAGSWGALKAHYRD